MKIKIEKNIPIPGEHSARIKYPFEQMKKGDSFLIRVWGGKKPKFKARNLSQSAINFCRIHKLNWKFTYRIIGNGVRIWRIK